MKIISIIVFAVILTSCSGKTTQVVPDAGSVVEQATIVNLIGPDAGECPCNGDF